MIARHLGGLLLGTALLAGCSGSPPATPAVSIPPIAQQVAVGPASTATAQPTSSPVPLPVSPMPPTPTVASPLRLVIIVTGSGGNGLSLRKTPGAGDRLKVLKDGTELTVLGAEQQAAGHSWVQVKDQDGTEGWVAAEFTTLARANGAAALPALITATGPLLTPTMAIIATPTIPPTPKPGGRATPQRSDCPVQAPIKGNQSGLYHLPGGASYAATEPEACFATTDDADAAGFTRAKR